MCAAVLGSGGAFGVAVYFARRWVEKRLEQAEKGAETRRSDAAKRYELNDEYEHARGRLLFWIVHGLKKFDPDREYFNGELQKAFEDMEACEKRLKELDRRQLARLNEDE